MEIFLLCVILFTLMEISSTLSKIVEELRKMNNNEEEE